MDTSNTNGLSVYDFDGTIYDGDSSRDMIKYGLIKHPFKTIKSLKKAKKLNNDYKSGIVSFDKVKEAMFSFIFEIPNYPKFINKFVFSHMKKIKPFYNSRKTKNDLIATASYELWISIFARNLGVKHVIATKTDSEGHIIGNNCKGIEKVKKIKELFPNTPILCSYSDSSVDIPILEMASTAYVVEGNKLITYKKGYVFKNNK